MHLLTLELYHKQGTYRLREPGIFEASAKVLAEPFMQQYDFIFNNPFKRDQTHA